MSQNFQSFYKGKNIFVTGHTGFKGAWLCLWLKELGANVTAYALAPEDVRGNFFSISGLGQSINSIIGDIRDSKSLENAVKEAKPDIVFHMAAQPLVRQSYDEPLETYQTNVIGTLNLFEAIRKTNSVKAVVNVTTDKCYENLERDLPYKEDDALGGYDPYSSSKACAEILTASYRRSFLQEQGAHLATARAGNVIGGGDFSTDRIIPDIVEAIIKNQVVELRNPQAVRPWQHVMDALYGYMLLAEKLYNEGEKYASAYNFGPDDVAGVTVVEITKKFIEKIRRGSYKEQPCSKLHEANMLRLDASKAKDILGWRPILNVEESIQYTADWFKEYIDSPNNITQVTLKQINQFSLSI